MLNFTLKRGDRLPVIRAVLRDVNGPIDLTDCDVKFAWRNKATNQMGTGDAIILNEPAGEVEYAWAAGDTLLAGTYEAEFEITFPDLRVLTVPNDGNIEFAILSDIAQ